MAAVTDSSTVLDPLQAQRFANNLLASCRRVADLQVNERPWPHLFCSDFNSEFVVSKLYDELPPASWFASVEEGGNVLRSQLSGGYYWNLYDVSVRHLLFLLMPAFANWLPLKDRQLRELGLACSRVRPYPSFWGYSNPERGVPPHTDGESAILTAVSVMGYADGLPAPVTNFFDRVAGTDCVYVPSSDYPPARGSLLVWLNLENAFHGVREALKPNRLTHIAAIESFRLD
jgi:hypothetical protein